MASALKNPGAIPVDWVAFRPGMLCDGRLRGLAFDASFLMLFESSFEASLGLTDIDLSIRARHFVYYVRMFFDGERVFDLGEHGPEGRARPKHHSDVIAPARLPDPLTNASYIR